MQNRAMIFMDHQNFIISLKEYYKKIEKYSPRIDYTKLSQELINKIPLEISYIKTFIFAPKPDEFLMQSPQWNGYSNLVSGIGYRNFIDVIESRMIARPTENWHTMNINNRATYVEMEKGTDVNLATHLLSKAFFNAFDTAIIISGDSDYEETFKVLKLIGKAIVLIGIEGQNTRRLNEFSDYTLYVNDDLFSKCIQEKRDFYNIT